MNYRIADLNIQMEVSGRTKRHLEHYGITSDQQADMVIQFNSENFQKKHPHLSLDECEYLASNAAFSHRLIDFNGFTLHASAIEVNGYAYLLSASSGTGKSTHTSLWRSVFGSDRVLIINDDKPAIRLVEGIWYSYGTPWSGETDMQRNVRVPIAGICFLEQGSDNEIHRLVGSKAAPHILNQTVRPKNTESMLRLLELTDRLIQQIPIWQLVCTPTEAAARLSFENMVRKEQKHENS